MKKILLSLSLLVTVLTHAQNVGIGTSTPASRLTLDGNNPDIGFMNNGLAHGFIKANGVNFTIGTSPDNPTGKLILGTKDNDHFNIDNFGRVSIGTSSSFDAELKLNGSSATRFALMHQDVAKGSVRLAGDDFVIGTYPNNSGRLIISQKGVDRIWVDEDGQMGIGTSTPSAVLTVNGTNPVLQLRNGDVNKGFMLLNGNDIRVGTNSTNTTGILAFQTKLLTRMTIDENGLIGIGTTNPGTILTINGTNPILQLRNADVDKGFVQLVNDDIKIGVNSANSNGRFIIRTDATDRMWVHNNGRVSMGTSLSTGGQLAIGNDNGTAGINFFNDNANTFNISSFGGNAWVETYTDQLILRSGTGASLYLKNNGQATIGLVSPANGYRLTVLGKIMCADITTSNSYTWPDYVFEKDYRLRPLTEVKKFIEENKHLPNIPSAKEIEKNGLQLGDMSKRLIEKVEELTLYILQLQEQVDELKKKDQARTEK